MTDIPETEWWYAMPQNMADDALTATISAANRAYQNRFGRRPEGVPRIFSIGKANIIAYPVELEPPAPEPAQLALMEMWP